VVIQNFEGLRKDNRVSFRVEENKEKRLGCSMLLKDI